MPVSAKNDPPPGGAPRGVLRAVLHTLILFHLAAVVGWSFSVNDPLVPFNQLLRSQLGRYMWPTGFWQAWDMFAPNPVMANVYLEADVTLADGSRVTWPFPRADRMGYFERYRRERYRKWATERVWAGGKVNPTVAAAAARYAARQVEKPGNPAAAVELVRYQALIDPPKRKPLRHYRDAPAAWDRLVFYTWTPQGGRVVMPIPPSPGTPGEGRGEGSSNLRSQITKAKTLTPTLSRSTGRGGNATAPATSGGGPP